MQVLHTRVHTHASVTDTLFLELQTLQQQRREQLGMINICSQYFRFIILFLLLVNQLTQITETITSNYSDLQSYLK